MCQKAQAVAGPRLQDRITGVVLARGQPLQLAPGEDREDVIARVDAAMYRAKTGGRNRVERGGAPRDALITDITPETQRGAAYGLRQAMDTVGAFAGQLATMGLMAASHDDFRLAFWVAVIPAVVCVLLIAIVVEKPEAARSAAKVQFPITRASLARLTSRFWWVVAFAAVLTLARFSEAFLLLRAENVGLAATWVPLILIVMNVVYAASAYPFDMLFDKLSRRTLLVWGVMFLIAADIVLALAANAWAVGLGAAIWGLHMGAMQGLLSALVASGRPFIANPDLVQKLKVGAVIRANFLANGR